MPQISDKGKTEVKKFKVVSNDFVGPLMPDTFREGEINYNSIPVDDQNKLIIADMKYFLYDKTAIDPNKTEEDYYKDYLLTRFDLNKDGQITMDDYNLASNTPLISDFLKGAFDVDGDSTVSIMDITMLQKALNGEKVSLNIDQNEFVKFVYNSDLKDLENRRDCLETDIGNYEIILDEYKFNIDHPEIMEEKYGITKEELETMLEDAKTELAYLKLTIKNQKKTIEQLPYLQKMQTTEFLNYAKDHKTNWQDGVPYEEYAYNYINLGYKLGSARPDDQNMQVDWLSVVEYIVEQGGEYNEYGDLTDSFQKYFALSESERMMYHYLFETEGYEAAEAYYKVIENKVTAYRGKILAEKFLEELASGIIYDENGNVESYYIENTLRTSGLSFLKGFDSGMQSFYDGILKYGEEDYTASEYEQMYIMQYLADNGLLTGSYNAGQVAGNVSTATAVTLFCTMVLPEGAGSYAALFFNNSINLASQKGNAEHYALVNGNTEEKAQEYASQIAKNQLFVQLTSAVIGYGIGATGQFASVISGTERTALQSFAISAANISIAGAGAAIGVYNEAKIKEAVLNEYVDYDELGKDAFNAAIMSIVIGAMSEGVSKSFEVMLDGEGFSFSTEDCLEYFLKNPDSTPEEFVRGVKLEAIYDVDTNAAMLVKDDSVLFLPSATMEDYHTRWSKRELQSWAHENFDGYFGSDSIDRVMQKVNKVSDDYWPTLLAERGLRDTTTGFVDRDHNLYLPESSNMHTAYHELFHQLSEIYAVENNIKFVDSNGNYRKVTGIRRFYSDGFDSNLANETLTEYLSSKYTDGKLYNSMYDVGNAQLWARIDDAMIEVYGQEGSNILINAYMTNDTTQIEQFFNNYSTNGSYDDFIRSLKYYATPESEKILTGIESKVYKSSNSIGSKIKSFFGRR